VDDLGQPWEDWTVVLRRRPVRIVAGRPEGGYTDAYEIICCDCGDDPDLDYRQASLALQRIRGPYRLLAGVTAYEKHVRRHQSRQAARLSGCLAPGQYRPTSGLTRLDDPACQPAASAARPNGRRHG
jgi:hypothetical protein